MIDVSNNVTLIGSVGNDPEIRNFESGDSVANFSLATTTFYKNKEGERVDKTQWHKLVAWKHLADLAEKYIKKGSPIAVNGSIEYRSYDAQDGSKKYITEIKVSSIKLLGKKGDTNELPQQAPQPNVTEDTGTDDIGGEVGDLPF